MSENSLHTEPSKLVPEVRGHLKQRIVTTPETIYRAGGIRVLGTRFKSLTLSTDVAILEDHNAQVVMAVYPFTPQLSTIDAILDVSQVPVFVGVGGGVTSGQRTVNIALRTGLCEARGVVANAPINDETIQDLYDIPDIPAVATVVSSYDNITGKVKSGARILDVSGRKNTAKLMKKIRGIVGPESPIIATNGDDKEQVLATIQADANAITYTPPTTAVLFREIMTKYRQEKKERFFGEG